MNNFSGIGRLTADPEIKYGDDGKPIGSYTLAVDKKFKREGQPSADFIPCKVYGKNAEFVEKHLKKGLRIGVIGSINTWSVENKEGKKIYGWNVNVSSHSFCQSKSDLESNASAGSSPASEEQDFVSVPDSDLEELPFN